MWTLVFEFTIHILTIFRIYSINYTMKQTKKKFKFWRRILLVIFIILIYIFTKNITLNEKITIQQGESANKILNQLTPIEKFRMKLYIKTHAIDFSKLEAGNYTFSGQYSKAEFIQNILKGSEKDYLRITILEGRSIYDIDEALAKKWYSNAGEYLSYVSDPIIINEINRGKASGGYDFLDEKMYIGKALQSLEWFLYPDTYNIDKNKPFIPQLVKKQLQTFESRVRKNISNPNNWYKTIILASILEKEERNNENKATVAGIFLKRLEIWMKIDADITLCYGLKTSYTSCTPAVIGRNVRDSNNIYNTRQVRGLPPTAISNPTRESINAVLNPQSSNYLYYLHDMQGNIHYGSSLEEHNQNKQMYLK